MRIHPRHAAALVATLALCMSTLAGCGGSTAANSEETVKIGVLEIAKAGLIDSAVQSFQDRVREQMAPVDVEFEVKNANGDQSLIGNISRSFAGGDYDAFAVIGTPAVTSLATQVRDRPIFAIAMGDPVGAKVAASLDNPGGNVSGSTDYVEPAELLHVLAGSTPPPATIGTIYDPSNQNMAVWSKALHAAADKAGVQVVDGTISGPNDVPSATRGVAGRVDALLIGPDATTLAALDAVGAEAADAEIPLYVVGGDATVPGVAATIGPDYAQLGVLAADAAVSVLKDGEEPGDVAFAQPDATEVTVNQTTLDALGITLEGGAVS